MTASPTDGTVIKKYSGFYYVQDGSKKIYECKLRGKVKHNQVLTGDRVNITLLEGSTGIIESVHPRRNELYRPKIANVNFVMIVMACDRPAPSLMLLDRLLFLSQVNHIEPCIILNKCDLPDSETSELIKNYYEKAGFILRMISAKKGIGIEPVQELLQNKIAVMAGPSGVGKSTLMNALSEGLTVKTQEVSSKIGRGKHTTRHVELFPLAFGGLIADTPGFSVISLPEIPRREVAAYFPDLQKYDKECEFADCMHYKEKVCGIKKAVETGIIAEFRYQNYLSMLEEIINNERY